MSFSQNNGLRFYQFDSLQIRHAVFTRHGGTSPEPWGSLNLGGTVGDEIERVRKNRFLCFDAMGCKPESIFDVWQVHSADAVCADAPRKMDELYQKADIILTDRPDVRGTRDAPHWPREEVNPIPPGFSWDDYQPCTRDTCLRSAPRSWPSSVSASHFSPMDSFHMSESRRLESSCR